MDKRDSSQKLQLTQYKKSHTSYAKAIGDVEKR